MVSPNLRAFWSAMKLWVAPESIKVLLLGREFIVASTNMSPFSIISFGSTFRWRADKNLSAPIRGLS